MKLNKGLNFSDFLKIYMKLVSSDGIGQMYQFQPFSKKNCVDLFALLKGIANNMSYYYRLFFFQLLFL